MSIKSLCLSLSLSLNLPLFLKVLRKAELSNTIHVAHMKINLQLLKWVFINHYHQNLRKLLYLIPLIVAETIHFK